MFNILILFLSGLFFIDVFFKTIFWLHLWQIKEYRLDRLIVHLRETIQGRALVFGEINAIRIALIFIYVLTIFINFLTFYTILVLVLFIFLARSTYANVRDRKIKIPDITAKIFLIFLSTLFIAFLLFIFAPIDIALWVLIVDMLVPLLIGLQMYLFSIPAEFAKDSTINKAIKKREKFPSLLVIGITGSYGKGSTKEYMASILSQKFNVAKTPETYNTPIGIARAILKDVNSKTKIFIVEMGAYKKGEIRFMSSMVKPLIGILTAVNEQHISLFGSIQNTMKAKYELIDSIPNNGISLFNGNNENAFKLFKKTRKKKILYKVVYGKQSASADILANKVFVGPLYLRFSIDLRGKYFATFTVNLIGSHHIENLLPGIWVALKMGMTKDEIKKAINTIVPYKKTMEPYTAQSGAILIDDTFNANPASVYAALSYLKTGRGKRILVLQPMIELGNSALKHHFEIGKEIGKTCDMLFLTNKNFYPQIVKGITQSLGQTEIYVLPPREIADKINSLKSKDVVVFEGKESGNCLGYIEKRKVFGE